MSRAGKLEIVPVASSDYSAPLVDAEQMNAGKDDMKARVDLVGMDAVKEVHSGKPALTLTLPGHSCCQI